MERPGTVTVCSKAGLEDGPRGVPRLWNGSFPRDVLTGVGEHAMSPNQAYSLAHRMSASSEMLGADSAKDHLDTVSGPVVDKLQLRA